MERKGPQDQEASRRPDRELTMPTKFVIEVGEDIIRDVREYSEAQGLQPYEWIAKLVRRTVLPANIEDVDGVKK